MAKRKTILWQLFFSHLVLVGFSVIAVAWVTLGIFKQFHYSRTSDNLVIRSRLLSQQFSEMLNRKAYAEIEPLVKTLGQKTRTRITIVLPDGTVVGDSHEDVKNLENHSDRPEILLAKKNGVGSSHRYSYTLRQHMMYTALALHDGSGSLIGYIRTSLPLTGLRQSLLAMNKKIALGATFIILLTMVISYLVSQRISRPLVRIKQGAEKYAAGDLDHKLYADGSEEIRSLTETLNGMAGELKRRMDTVARQKQELSAVLSGMTEGVLAVDRDENVIYMNGSAETLFELAQGWQAGRKLQELVRNGTLQEFIIRALASGEIISAELKFFRNGEKHMHVTGSPIKSPSGWVSGAIVVFNDITQIYQLENIRREFVANVSHELKTPITLIQGFVETLMDEKEFQEGHARQFLGKIRTNSERLNAIIEDLLDLSRIEQSGIGQTERVLVRVRDAVANVIQSCQGMHALRPGELENHVPEDLEISLNAPLFEQALLNLLENAVKYSGSKKPVRVDARLQGGRCIIEVRDFGNGIDSEHLPRLFERFYRVDKSRSRGAGGTGLGLAIVKHIVQAHQGEITVESTVGQGTCFRINLPASA